MPWGQSEYCEAGWQGGSKRPTNLAKKESLAGKQKAGDLRILDERSGSGHGHWSCRVWEGHILYEQATAQEASKNVTTEQPVTNTIHPQNCQTQILCSQFPSPPFFPQSLSPTNPPPNTTPLDPPQHPPLQFRFNPPPPQHRLHLSRLHNIPSNLKSPTHKQPLRLRLPLHQLPKILIRQTQRNIALPIPWLSFVHLPCFFEVDVPGFGVPGGVGEVESEDCVGLF